MVLSRIRTKCSFVTNILKKFFNILYHKILNLTPREKILLDKMLKEEMDCKKSSIFYIKVSSEGLRNLYLIGSEVKCKIPEHFLS